MSSLLALHPGTQNFDFARSQSAAGRCAGDRPPHSTDTSDQAAPSWFQGGLPTPPGTKAMTGVSLNGNQGAYSQSQRYGQNYSSGPVPQPYKSHSRVPSEPYSHTNLAIPRPATSFESGHTEKSKANSIASHLQIPESVNKSKGSLAEFTAEITCLFWFESAATLEYAEQLSPDSLPDRGLVPDATPSLGFKKWVTTILSTTQVGKNVILLALMFIYRLKKFNPSVSGKRGSEFRLLTIALMLGNKFLDDNTYTNKTWAEVSGISVTEIHIMEVEFLSNMKYDLYASEADWASWKALLGKFGTFYEKALRFHLQQQQDDNRPNLPITPVAQTFAYKLPSPPSGHSHAISLTTYHTLPNPMTTLPQLPRSPVRQQMPSGISERKRSIDPSETLPPAKRLHYSTSSNVSSPGTLAPGSVSQLDTNTPAHQGNQVGPFSGTRIPQLPIPRLPPTTIPSGTHLAPLNLPPTRAMTNVYPAATTAAWSQPVTPISAIPPTLTGQYQNGVVPVPEGQRSKAGSAHTSPVNMYGPSTPTRQGLSPSYFLTNRSSPYRPVRHVNTLLIPPPSAAMQNAVRNVSYEQMHYQPLGRPSERKIGTVPFYQHEGWNQSNVSTPTTTLYRPF